ncbi:MAG: ExbD/TolR family protein [Nitrospinota bacterium]
MIKNRRKYRRVQRAMSEINVTPFVDVMLVLLIIFMVTAPLARHGLEIKLPSVDTGAIKKEEKWVIAVYKNRNIFFNDKRIKLANLQGRLAQIIKKDPAAQVFLKADEVLPYGFVARVMASARRAGVRNLGMITEPLIKVK